MSSNWNKLIHYWSYFGHQKASRAVGPEVQWKRGLDSQNLNFFFNLLVTMNYKDTLITLNSLWGQGWCADSGWCRTVPPAESKRSGWRWRRRGRTWTGTGSSPTGCSASETPVNKRHQSVKRNSLGKPSANTSSKSCSCNKLTDRLVGLLSLPSIATGIRVLGTAIRTSKTPVVINRPWQWELRKRTNLEMGEEIKW